MTARWKEAEEVSSLVEDMIRLAPICGEVPQLAHFGDPDRYRKAVVQWARHVSLVAVSFRQTALEMHAQGYLSRENREH